MSSCSSCGEKTNTMNTNATIKKSTNNSVCPYRMSDGRNFTDYRTRCTIAYEMKQKTNFLSSYDERQYMIHNAENIMNKNMQTAENMNSCSGCFPKNSVGTMLPEKNMTQCNSKTCTFQNNVNPTGLGTGRNYNVK